jgi:tetratricopeptide (TPR) repeat protein
MTNAQQLLDNGLKAIGKGSLHIAEDHLKQAIKAQKDLMPAYLNLAQLYLHQDRHEDARNICYQAIEVNPNTPDAYSFLGKSLLDQQEFAKAEKVFKKSIEINPDSFTGYYNVGRALIDQGKNDEAISFLEESLTRNPAYPDTHYNLSRVKKYTDPNDPHIKAMYNLIPNPQIDPLNKGLLYISMGKAYNDLKDYDRAFECYQKGKGLFKEHMPPNPENSPMFFKHLKNIGTKEFLEQHKNSGTSGVKHIFVVGLPRSGTSLVEQIISSHPDVFGAGELCYIWGNDEKHKTALNEFLKHNEAPMSPKAIKEIANNYQKRLDELPTDKKRIVNKKNFNFLYIPLIKAAFPDAKIINCQRDPMDNCFSIFKIMFLHHISFANDLTDIAIYYKLYKDIMEYYRQIMPDFILDIQYEDLVEDTETQIRKIIDFCDLDWNDRCLEFYNAERHVRTPSSLQVSKPIYKSSVGAWKNYEKHLQPLKNTLTGNINTKDINQILSQASTFYQQGNLNEAASLLQKASQINKNDMQIYLSLARIYIQQEDYEAAVKTCVDAIEVDPNAHNFHAILAQSLLKLERFEEAEKAARKSIELYSGDIRYYSNLGAILFEYGKYGEAEDIFKKVVEDAPDEIGGYANVGHAMVIQGKKDEAVPYLEKTIEIDPLYVSAHNELSQTKKYKNADDPHIKKMKSILASTKLSPTDEGSMNISLGNAYESIGEYDTAFRHFKKGNKLIRSFNPSDLSNYENHYNAMKKYCGKDFLDKHKDSGIKDFHPIFIVGLPRSGTSLLEQILASHPDVFGAGELPFIKDCVKNYLYSSTYKDDKGIIMEPEEVRAMAEYYIRNVSAMPTEGRRITDKMPANHSYIPAIKVMFPNAKIINTRRDPMDSCMSMYKRHFRDSLYFSYDLEDLGKYYNLYSDLIDYYHELMPGFIMDMTYEEVVDDFEAQVRKMLEFCDLPWNDACMKFHKTERRVKTASSLQVKQPLYKDSVKAWKHFEKQLAPLHKIIYGEGSS